MKMDEERVNESDFATKLVKDFCTTETGLGLSVAGDSDLDIDKIISLFEGCRDNADYFNGLWQAVKAIGGEKMAGYSCDPRDERKRLRVGSWKPAIRDDHCVEFEKEVDEDEALAVKQTVVEDEKTVKERHLGTNNEASDDLEDTESKRFHCGVYGCGEILSSLACYEAHYHHCHSYTCASCRRVFVSNFLLDIHLQENHDSYFAVLSPRIDMYRCLVESCEVKFRTADLRKDHLIASHKFPSNFSFHQPLPKARAKTKTTKVKGTTKSSTQPSAEDSQATGMEIGGGGDGGDVKSRPPGSAVDDHSAIVAMDTELPEASPTSSWSSSSNRKSKNGDRHTGRNSANSQAKKVPSSVCFGRGSQRAFQQHRGRGRGGVRGRNWYQTTSCLETDTSVDIETVDMMELATALT